ncbi:hypothetical protein [Streptomyces sp. NPDC001546]|uniref:hypothetical protein n=1 Tax=Streptomyces sp. NPDC001546 TaxID=3364585 RepID=UPI0036CFC2A2
MTETVTEPQAPPEETTTAPAAPEPETTGKKHVEHTPGGFPVVPLAFSGANSAAGLVATAALAGGPAAAVVAMTSAAALAAVATRHRTKNTKPKPGSKASPAGIPRAGSGQTAGRGGGLLGRVPAQPGRTSRTGGAAGTGRSHHKASGGQAGHRTGTPGAGSGAGRSANTGRPAGKSGSSSSAQRKPNRALDGLAGGRAGQVRDLRAQSRAGSPTRAEQRQAAKEARRQVADSRRAAKATDRAASTKAKPRGLAARTLAKGMSKAAAVRDRAVAAGRTARDRSAGRAVAAARNGVKAAAVRKRAAQLKAPAQKAARKALLRSAARVHARRALAAVLGGAAGLLGMATTPLGRKLGWGWLMNPGRRLYRALVHRARLAREARDAAIRADLEDAEEAADAQAMAEQEADEPIGDRAERPTTRVPAPPTHEGAPMSHVSGFRFEELAAEMEQAAQSYEPENCMEILAMLEGLPEALQAIANILRILAERADAEFPLEKVVADMLSDLFQVFTNSVEFSEELGPTFRQAHEADIARFEDPRNGHEAEKGWNV